MPQAYPQDPSARTRWILERRPPRHTLDPQRPYAFCIEDERTEHGDIVPVATVFLTNRECPWRCLMCDLWRNTLTETVPVGAIPNQIDFALANLAPSLASRNFSSLDPQSTRSRQNAAAAVSRSIRHLKLYNSGSFFDPKAIPVEDYAAIARRVRAFERVIVECHPALVGDVCLEFRDLLGGTLEVAMGLETVHEAVLERLNKRMTLRQFARAAEFLTGHGIAVRVFILVQPPFIGSRESLIWAQRSLDFAFDHGASVASLIPMRPGNGALDALMTDGHFTPPRLETLEAAAEYGIALQRGRVFADLWDLERFAECRECFPARLERLREMNLRQVKLPPIACAACQQKREL